MCLCPRCHGGESCLRGLDRVSRVVCSRELIDISQGEYIRGLEKQGHLRSETKTFPLR